MPDPVRYPAGMTAAALTATALPAAAVPCVRVPESDPAAWFLPQSFPEAGLFRPVGTPLPLSSAQGDGFPAAPPKAAADSPAPASRFPVPEAPDNRQPCRGEPRSAKCRRSGSVSGTSGIRGTLPLWNSPYLGDLPPAAWGVPASPKRCRHWPAPCRRCRHNSPLPPRRSCSPHLH